MLRRFPAIPNTLAAATVLAAGQLLMFAAESFAWQDTNSYRPPNFEATFPVDDEAGAHLDLLFKGSGPGTNAGENIFGLFRKGLRTATAYHQTLFSWLGNRFVWNQSPQNPRAIDLAYHAVGSTNREIRDNAIYFCLSTVRPMTEPILRTLVDIGLRSEDPNVLGRIAWGGAEQNDRLLVYLKPSLETNDAKVRAHAESVRDIFSGKIKAFAWAAERARKKAEEKYGTRLAEFRSALQNGDSASRRETLGLIQRERIELIMDESFIPAFAAAAEDPDPKIRNAIVVIAGSRWVWNGPQPAEAIELMMRLSRDADPQVRRSANYYGLSTLRERSDEIVERMIEMAMHDGFHNRDFRGRITWGLKSEGERVRRVLEKWIGNYRDDLIKAGFAYGFHLDYFAEKPKGAAEFEKLFEGEKPAARALAFEPTAGYQRKDMEEFFTALRQDLPPEYRPPTRWISGEMPFLVVREEEASVIEKALAMSPRFKKLMDRAVPLHQIIQWGKEGDFESRN